MDGLVPGMWISLKSFPPSLLRRMSRRSLFSSRPRPMGRSRGSLGEGGHYEPTAALVAGTHVGRVGSCRSSKTTDETTDRRRGTLPGGGGLGGRTKTFLDLQRKGCPGWRSTSSIGYSIGDPDMKVLVLERNSVGLQNGPGREVGCGSWRGGRPIFSVPDVTDGTASPDVPSKRPGVVGARGVCLGGSPVVWSRVECKQTMSAAPDDGWLGVDVAPFKDPIRLPG